MEGSVGWCLGVDVGNFTGFEACCCRSTTPRSPDVPDAIDGRLSRADGERDVLATMRRAKERLGPACRSSARCLGVGIYSTTQLDLNARLTSILRLPLDPYEILDLLQQQQPVLADVDDDDHTDCWFVVADRSTTTASTTPRHSHGSGGTSRAARTAPGVGRR